MQLDAPIVAVTVHPRRARVVRRGRVALRAGASELVVAGLTDRLLAESVRVAVGGPARVVGVDVAHRDLAAVPDERVRAAEAAVRAAERGLAAVDGADAGDAAREQMLQRLALRSGDRLAAALADGSAEPARVVAVGAAVAGQLAEVAAARRDHAERRVDAERAVAAAEAELHRLTSAGRSRRDAVVAVESDTAAEVDVELGYVVEGASWSSAYDARLDGEQVALTWYGMVMQRTGEDWPACEMTLSTARPAAASALPELDPWWVDVARPLPRPAPAGPEAAFAMRVRPSSSSTVREDVAVEAEPEEGLLAGAWRLARPTAVAADGTPHRTTVTTTSAPARLDHVCAPARGPEVHLRATLVNGGGHVLPAGPVATFVDDAFVGTTALATTAPGEEIALALGPDDRVVVERELLDRTAHKARFGSGRSSVQRWRTRVVNRRDTAVRVVVRDRLPVSRAAEVKVVDVAVRPEPAERDDLGRLEWVAELGPGQRWEGLVQYGVEHPRDVTVTGYR